MFSFNMKISRGLVPSPRNLSISWGVDINEGTNDWIFHALRNNDWILGFSASRLLGFSAFSGSVGFSGSRGSRFSGSLGLSASGLLGVLGFFRLLAFSASRVLGFSGFSGSLLLGFSASRPLVFSTSRLLGVLGAFRVYIKFYAWAMPYIAHSLHGGCRKRGTLYGMWLYDFHLFWVRWFSGSRVPRFSASRHLGFSACRLLDFSASRLFGVLKFLSFFRFSEFSEFSNSRLLGFSGFSGSRVLVASRLHVLRGFRVLWVLGFSRRFGFSRLLGFSGSRNSRLLVVLRFSGSLGFAGSRGSRVLRFSASPLHGHDRRCHAGRVAAITRCNGKPWIPQTGLLLYID